MTTELPNIADELERKTTETLLHIAARREAGELDERAAHLQAKAVWYVVSGLVSHDLSGMAERLTQENKDAPQRRHFVSADHTKSPLILGFVPGTAYSLTKINPASGERTVLKRGRVDSQSEIEAIAARLISGGYIEL